MCIDYRDLNRASPKDDFPLPNIGVYMDDTTRHALFSFIDDFSGYNQIQMAPEYRENTLFVGTFCYKAISFGLKNAEITY